MLRAQHGLGIRLQRVLNEGSFETSGACTLVNYHVHILTTSESRLLSSNTKSRQKLRELELRHESLQLRFLTDGNPFSSNLRG